MLAGGQVLEALGLQENREITEVRFEGAAEIDDLELISPAGHVLIQAKRTLQLSDQMDSEFASVLKQFVRQYCHNPERDDLYVIATSSRSSRRITQDLKKLTEARRLNETGSDENPLTKSEAEVLQKTYSLIGAHLGTAGLNRTERDIDQVFRRINVVVLHIEAGEAHELIANAVLASKGAVDAPQLWHLLLQLSLSLAKDRLSIDAKGLHHLYGSYLGDSCERAGHKNARALQTQLKGRLCAARDVILMRMGEMPEFRVYQQQPDEYAYQVFEFFRFGEDGTKRLTFIDDRCQLSSGPCGVILRRTATYEGMTRYLKENPEFAAEKVYIMGANYTSDPETQPAAKLHSEYLAKQLDSLQNFLECLQCGDPIFEENAVLIEIDEQRLPCEVGLVHTRCLRPAHRVLGGIDSELFRTHALLQDFDFEGWVAAARNGQGFFSTIATLNNGPTRVSWVRDYNQLSRGGWCVRLNLADGSALYATERGRVTRNSEAQAIKSVALFNEQLMQLREEGNPQCYADGLGMVMPYSAAVEKTGDSRKCIEVVDTQPVRYTRSIARTYSVSEQFYAPLALLISAETGEPIVINEWVFLISNPFHLESLLDNWKKAGWHYPEFSVTFLRSDDEFDKFVNRLHAAGVRVVVDPLMSLNQELVKGFVIEDYYDLLKSGAPIPADAPPQTTANEASDGIPSEEGDDVTPGVPPALLIVKPEADGTFTHTYISGSIGSRVIATGCRSGTCQCLGCRIVELRYDDGTGTPVPVVHKNKARESKDGELILPIYVGDEIIVEMLTRELDS